MAKKYGNSFWCFAIHLPQHGFSLPADHGISSSLRWSGHARAFKQRLSWDRWSCNRLSEKKTGKKRNWNDFEQIQHVHLCIYTYINIILCMYLCIEIICLSIWKPNINTLCLSTSFPICICLFNIIWYWLLHQPSTFATMWLHILHLTSPGLNHFRTSYAGIDSCKAIGLHKTHDFVLCIIKQHFWLVLNPQPNAHLLLI